MVKVVDFYADWCPPCKMMAPLIEELEKELVGKVEFEKVNIDENQSRAAQNNVMSIPTYLVMENGKEKNRLVGATSKDEFLKFIFK